MVWIRCCYMEMRHVYLFVSCCFVGTQWYMLGVEDTSSVKWISYNVYCRWKYNYFVLKGSASPLQLRIMGINKPCLFCKQRAILSFFVNFSSNHSNDKSPYQYVKYPTIKTNGYRCVTFSKKNLHRNAKYEYDIQKYMCVKVLICFIFYLLQPEF